MQVAHDDSFSFPYQDSISFLVENRGKPDVTTRYLFNQYDYWISGLDGTQQPRMYIMNLMQA